MPTPRQHSNPAARQKAYRERQALQRAEELSVKGLPPAPLIPSMPGTARWNAMIQGAGALLQTAHDEMEEYHGERSDTWQDSERAEALQAKIDALGEVLALVEELKSA